MMVTGESKPLGMPGLPQDYGFDPLDDPYHYVGDGFPMPAEDFIPALRYKCTCDLQELIKYGCKCGGQ